MKFANRKEAIEYAEENIDKYDFLLAEVAGKKACLTSTDLPVENNLRNQLEAALEIFMIEVLEIDEEEAADVALEIGADITDKALDQIEKLAGVSVINAGLTY